MLAQSLDGGQHDRHLLDRVDGAALLGRQRRDAGVPRAAVHRDARQQAAAAGDPHGEAARLGDDGGVGLQRARGVQTAGARRFLLGHGVDDEVARQRDAELGERAGCDDHARHPALHVARPAAVEQALAQLGRERVGHRPVCARLDVDDVDVAVQQQRPPAAAPAEAPDELRAALERELGRHHGVRSQRLGVGLVKLHLGAVGFEQSRQVLLQRAFLAGRIAGRVRHGVERHELAGERDEGLAACRNGIDDALLQGRELHEAIP